MNDDQETRLGNLTAQAYSLAMIVHGVGGGAFRTYRDDIQDNVLWLLTDLLREVNSIVQGSDHE